MTIVDFYDKEQVDDLLEDKADASSVGKDTDAPSISGTLWARIKYVLAHWLTADSVQTVTAKKTFSVSPEVPTTPANDDSAVNSFYVNDSTGTVQNNLVHKDGDELISGKKTFGPSNNYILGLKNEDMDISNYPSSNKNTYLVFYDKNDVVVAQQRYRQYPSALGGLSSSVYIEDVNDVAHSATLMIGVDANDTDNPVCYMYLAGSSAAIRPFDPAKTTEVITTKTLIEALQYYGLIQ